MKIAARSGHRIRKKRDIRRIYIFLQCDPVRVLLELLFYSLLRGKGINHFCIKLRKISSLFFQDVIKACIYG